MSLQAIVALYRYCGRPQFRDNTYSGAVESRKGFELLHSVKKECRSQSPSAEITLLIVDGHGILEDEDIPLGAQRAEFEINVATNSESRFHADISTLLHNVPTICAGAIPTDYYLVAENYYSEENDEPATVASLINICGLITDLRGLAQYSSLNGEGAWSLLFIRSGENPFEIVTKVDTLTIEQARGADFRLAAELSADAAKDDHHYTAKIGVFSTTIADFLGNADGSSARFKNLASMWSAFAETYQRNLNTYISGFAFHAARRDVARAAIDLASELSSVLTDIAGKTLSVPVSMLAVVAMIRADGWVERLLLFIGIAVASVLLLGAVRNQRARLAKVKDAGELTLSSILGERNSFPEDLNEKISDMESGLTRDKSRVSLWLALFEAGCSVPLLAAGGLMFWWYGSKIPLLVEALLERVCG